MDLYLLDKDFKLQIHEYQNLGLVGVGYEKRYTRG